MSAARFRLSKIQLRQMARVAVIDTGTNSTRLLIADVTDGSVQELLRQTTVTRLGEGVDETRRLGSRARLRVSACVEAYEEEIRRFNVDKTIIIATSSVRGAADGPEFLKDLAQRFHMSYKLLSGQEEAALGFQGAALGLEGPQRLLLLDVGGGSTEIAAGMSGGDPDYCVSLDLGCVRLTERFFKSDPPADDEIKASLHFIRKVFDERMDRSRAGEFEAAVGVAGTATALAAIDLGLKEYDRDAVHGHTISRNRIDGLCRSLKAKTAAHRVTAYSLEPGRADVIVAGTLIVLQLMEYFDIHELKISERDILDGAARWFVRIR